MEWLVNQLNAPSCIHKIYEYFIKSNKKSCPTAGLDIPQEIWKKLNMIMTIIDQTRKFVNTVQVMNQKIF